MSRGDSGLGTLLEAGEVLCHPFVIGELVCGRIHNRVQILGLLAALPQTAVANHDELLRLVEQHRLYGAGLGWIDIHLLGSVLLSSCKLWTADKALREAASRLGINASGAEPR